MLYKLAKKTEENWSPSMRMPTNIAMSTISILQFINILTIYVLLVHGFNIIKPFVLSKELAVLIALIIYLLNYLYFLRKKRFLKIEMKFDKDSQKMKIVRKIFFWIYIISSFIILIFVLEKFKTVNR